MKKWFAEEFAFTITVTGFLQSEQTENYCRNGGRDRRSLLLYLWLFGEYRWLWDMQQGHATVVSADGCSAQRRRFEKSWRRRKIQQDCGLSRWLCDIPSDSRTAGKPEFLSDNKIIIQKKHCGTKPFRSAFCVVSKM